MSVLNTSTCTVNCFLCRFNTHRDAIEMNQFIEENIGHMHPDVIAQDVHAELANRMTDGHESMSASMIKEHICSHTLNPVVRIGIMLRGLVDLDDKMRNDLYKIDAQGQSLGLDPKMIDAYLRLQNQVINLYKSDPSRLFFNRASQQNAAGATSN
jgi:S-adenosylmethionine synthetase